MKRITITCQDDDLIGVIGAVLRINADFAVETLVDASLRSQKVAKPQQPEPQPKAKRRAISGPTGATVVCNRLKRAGAGVPISMAELGQALAAEGYNPSGVSSVLTRLRQQGYRIQRENGAVTLLD